MSPMAALRPCTWPGCGRLVGSGRCRVHARVERRAQDERRGSAHDRGYDSRWNKARKLYLIQHPLCVACHRSGRIVAGEVVDHIIPHHGDTDLFWDERNWQTLCKKCHDAKTACTDGRWGAQGG